MRITEDGSVTIPADLREALGLRVGDEVDFRLRDGLVMLLPVDAEGKTRGEQLVERLRGAGSFGRMSADEVMMMMRGESADDEIARLEAEAEAKQAAPR